MQSVTGRVIAGRYQLVARLGQGAMGTVWQANDPVLGREVAIKEIRLPAAMSTAEQRVLRERTLREARVAAKLSHPGVVTVYDVVETGGNPWIVMEFVVARSLEQVIAQDGRLPPRRVAAVGAMLLDALASAHSAGIVHRDVKPGNVLITGDERAVLTDFGIATLAGEPGLTQAGMVMGTPGFCAPERIRGEPASPASDLWSLGATLYAAAEGHAPFHSQESPMAILARIVHTDPPTATSAGPMSPVIDALMNRNPGQRPDAETAGAMLADVTRALTGLPRTVPAWQPPPEPGPGHTPAVFPRHGHAAMPADSASSPPRSQPDTPPPAATRSAVPPGPAQVHEVPWTRPPRGSSARPAATRGAAPPPRQPSPPLAAAPAQHEPAHRGTLPFRPGRRQARQHRGRAGQARRSRRRLLLLAGAGLAILCVGAMSGGMIVHAGRHRHGTVRGTHPSPGVSHLPGGYRWYSGSSGTGTRTVRFAMAVPQGWTVTETGTRTLVSNPLTGATITVVQGSAKSSRPPKGRVLARTLRRASSYPGYHTVTTSTTILHGQPATTLSFTYRLPATGTMEGLAVAARLDTPDRPRLYEFFATAPALGWPGTRDAFEAVLHTFGLQDSG